jgi:HJR/Mrr/RecB family endonuclease
MRLSQKLKGAAEPARQYLIELFVSTVDKLKDANERTAIIEWLKNVRDILGSSLGKVEKIRAINASFDKGAAAKAIVNNVVGIFQKYRDSQLPLSVKLALPATLIAAPLVGAQGAGLVAFGTGVGAPALLLVFIGTAGVSSIIEALVKSPQNRAEIADVIVTSVSDEIARKLSQKMLLAMKEQAATARRADLPADKIDLAAALAIMDPYAFEAHVVSFFEASGMRAWTTKKSNDYGVDGFAVHENGVIAIQCKRYRESNKAGGPDVLGFWGAIEHSGAWRGYFVTTSSFTTDAAAFAKKSEGKIVLIDGETLLRWHEDAPAF